MSERERNHVKSKARKVVSAKPSEEDAQVESAHEFDSQKERSKKHAQCLCKCVCVCNGMIVCVTLAWPGGKVGRQESQCVSSQAFSLRLAGFITATNHWPDKSSYFILPSCTSALFFSSHSFISPKTSSLSFLPALHTLALHASPCTSPGSLASFPSQHNSPIFYFLPLSSSLSFRIPHGSAESYTFLFLPFSTPPLALLLPLSPSHSLALYSVMNL